jgi:tetratricopeptide (TPR) repeat protein
MEDLDHSVETKERAVRLTPWDHAGRPERLTNLGGVLKTRFERSGKLEDIELAVLFEDQAVELTPADHSRRPARLRRLAAALEARFDRTGILRDLDRAVLLTEQAIEETPADHADHPLYLGGLGNALQTRYERLGDLKDLNRSLSTMQRAVDLIPDDHMDRPAYLNSLGTALETQFKRTGNVEALERSVTCKEQAIELCPMGHPARLGYLNNLGIALNTRFKIQHDAEDLDRAIEVMEQVVELAPEDDVARTAYITQLGGFLGARFEDSKDISDLHRAIAFQTESVALTPAGHLDRCVRSRNLGRNLYIRWDALSQEDDLVRATETLRSAALADPGYPVDRLEAAHVWALSCSHQDDLIEAVRACKVMFSLVPQVVWLGRSVSERYAEVGRLADMVNDAVSIAISAGELQLGVEWLEEGRSIVWSQLLQLRTPLDELRLIEPGLADRLEQLSQTLDQNSSSNGDDGSQPRQLVLEAESQSHRRFAEEREEIIGYSRKLPGFEDFLRPQKFSKLCRGAQAGNIVIVRADRDGVCDALIIPARSNKIMRIELPQMSRAKATNLQSKMTNFLQGENLRMRADRSSVPGGDLNKVLRVLWMGIVKPVFEALGLQPASVSPKQARLVSTLMLSRSTLKPVTCLAFSGVRQGR